MKYCGFSKSVTSKPLINWNLICGEAERKKSRVGFGRTRTQNVTIVLESLTGPSSHRLGISYEYKNLQSKKCTQASALNTRTHSLMQSHTHAHKSMLWTYTK